MLFKITTRLNSISTQIDTRNWKNLAGKIPWGIHKNVKKLPHYFLTKIYLSHFLWRWLELRMRKSFDWIKTIYHRKNSKNLSSTCRHFYPYLQMLRMFGRYLQCTCSIIHHMSSQYSLVTFHSSCIHSQLAFWSCRIISIPFCQS